MDKKLLMGGMTVLAVGAIGFGAYMMASDRSLRGADDNAPEVSEEDRAKIEALYWDQLKDKDKYSFCLAEANINGSYSDPVLNSNGTINYDSKEVLLFKKEEQRFYIVAREADYKYRGTFTNTFAGLSNVIPVNETGRLAEYYDRNNMPMRLDYSNNYIATNPDAKNQKWVYAEMGDEGEMTTPNSGCQGVFTLDSRVGYDLLIDGEQILIDRDCYMQDPIGGVYTGKFSFSCMGMDYNVAMDMIEDIKLKEELQNAKIIEAPIVDPDDLLPDFEEREDGAHRSSNDGDLIDSATKNTIRDMLGVGTDDSAMSPSEFQKVIDEINASGGVSAQDNNEGDGIQGSSGR